MNWQVIDKNRTPPNGWQFYQPQTNWKAPNPLAASFDGQVNAIIRHRQANPSCKGLPQAFAEVAQELENFTAHRLEFHPDIVRPLDEQAAEAQKKNTNTNPTGLQGILHAAGRAADRLLKDIAGLRSLAEWVGDGADPVENGIAYRRAETCLRCPKNIHKKTVEGSIAEAIREHESVRKKLDLSIPNEDQLGMCDACGCYLKLKVWVPIENIQAANMPPSCWVTSEKHPRSRPVNEADEILRFYKGTPGRPPRNRTVVGKETTLTNVALGLGDTVILTDICKATNRATPVWSASGHFKDLSALNPWMRDGNGSPFMANAPMLIHNYDCGGGHFIQRLRRAYGVPVELKPKGVIEGHGVTPKKNTVCIHVEAGRHALWQQDHVHPRARQVYPENVKVIEQFIKERKDLSFFTVGSKDPGIDGATFKPTNGTTNLIATMAEATWFLGIVSGPMHVATALGMRCICIINFPDPRRIFMPVVKSIGQIEEEWFYPQHVHLHQDGEGILVPKFSLDSLHRSFGGLVYPYWSDKFLHLIHENVS